MTRYTCPCCGCRTLENPPGRFDFCEVCWWEADSIQAYEPKYGVGGPNGVCLEEARRKFLVLGAMDERSRARTRPPTESEVPGGHAVRAAIDPRDLATWTATARHYQEVRDRSLLRITPRTRSAEASRREFEARRAHYQSMREQFGELYDGLLVLFAYHDPIDFGGADVVRRCTVDYTMYDSQAEGILPQLREANSPARVCELVHREFLRWFIEPVVGPEDRFMQLAEDMRAAYVESASSGTMFDR